MSTRALHDGLQASLEALADGEALDRVLSRHPDLAADLRPALETAELLQNGDGEGPPSAAMVRSRARVRAALPSHHPTPFLPRSRIIRILPRVAGALAAGLIAVAAGLGALAAASAYALPDSPFYIFKLAGEGLRLQLTLNSRARISLQESQNVAPSAPTESAPPARTQVPDGYDNEGKGRGQGSGEEEETEEPEDDESVQAGGTEEEEVEEVEEEGKKEAKNQNKNSHGGGPGSSP